MKLDSFYVKHELEDVIQHNSGLSGHLVRLLVWAWRLRNGCFPVQTCSSWALLLANVNIARELLPDQNSCSPLQVRAGVFSWNALIFTYCAIEKGCVFSLWAVFMLIRSIFYVSQYFIHLLSPQALTIYFTSVCVSSLLDIFLRSVMSFLNGNKP